MPRISRGKIVAPQLVDGMIRMALYLPEHNALFVHAPKTGGTFVADLLKTLDVPTKEYGYKHSHKDLIGPIRWMKRPYTFTFVRHPVSWYASYWEMKMRWPVKDRHWYYFGQHMLAHPTWEIDPHCGRDDFAKYIRLVAAHEDFLHTMFRAYTGLGTPDRIDFIGKQESLVADLCQVFDTIGVNYDPSEVTQAERVNFASGGPTAVWTPELRRLVLQSERRFLIDYGYDADGPRAGRKGRPAARTRPVNYPQRYRSRLVESQQERQPDVDRSGLRGAARRIAGAVLPRAVHARIRSRRAGRE